MYTSSRGDHMKEKINQEELIELINELRELKEICLLYVYED